MASSAIKLTARVVYRRVLWTAAGTSWAASMVAPLALLAAGVQIDLDVILLWALVVVHLTIGAMILSSLPSAEAIAARALLAVGAEPGDELADRRGN